VDLTRLRKIGNIPIEGTKMFLHFEEWSAAELDRFETTRLWVRVKGCPYKERCDYLALFVVGSLIGKAVEMDMEFTRERSIVRMLVDVTSPKLIPKTTVDHVYEGDGYGLLFKAENGSGDVDDDTDMDEAPSDDKNDNQDEHKESDENNFDDTKNNDNSSSGAVEPKQPEMSRSKNIVSAPAQVQFGTMDISPFMPLEGSLSEGKLRVFLPRKLWGDRDEEEGLLSPPSEPNVGLHTPGGRNVWTADGHISYTAT
jgi:hypothetical protein